MKTNYLRTGRHIKTVKKTNQIRALLQNIIATRKENNDSARVGSIKMPVVGRSGGD